MREVEAVFREERGRLLAALVRRFGDLDLAEEVTSDAVEAALRHWPVEGVPPNPGAWLMTTARRKAVDRLRREQALATRLAVLWAEAERAAPEAPAGEDGGLPDERLRLFFTCAHPALPAEDRGALTLRCLAGLTTPEVARAYLVPAQTMAKRIVRAKKKIREARIPIRVPDPGELPERVPGVLQVIYSIFTEGYAASSGPRLQRLDLAEEAIRLARILRRLLPAEREVAGLLALLLLVHARRAARTGPGGEPMLLDEQDRGLWDRAMRDGPEAGLALLEELAGARLLRGYQPYLAARADLLHRLGRLPEAAAAYRSALEAAGSEPERALLRRRLAEAEGAAGEV
ncbi:RNA polymerase sigma factor [Nonomuraea spiralis]|uniref:RNA polymerase sigma factor n=1 Tax=Nonomuraea spiralis TaxID=46182 RepID=UPI003795ABDE